MDELWLRELLDRATASEPPIGPVATNALRAGITRRRRRRAQGTAACVAAVAVIGAAAVAMTGPRQPATGPPRVTGPSTVYVLTGVGAVRPIPSATGRPGKTIPVGNGQIMAITPDGKTIYVGDDYVSQEQPKPAVVPVSTVTDTASKPILMRGVPSQILITPNGKTAYVLGLAGAEIIPIATATNTPEKGIKVGMTVGGVDQMAITPDGKTLYVVSWTNEGKAPSYVIPIATATNTPGKPIKIQNADVGQIVMNPDGQTAYALGQSTSGTVIVPIATATNTPGKPVRVGGEANVLAITPDGRILYLLQIGNSGVKSGSSDVIPFATATDTPGKPIKIAGFVYGMAVSPDSGTAYAAGEPSTKAGPPGCTGQTGEVTPISTATNTAGNPIRVGCDPYFLAITPDGKTVWVANGDRTLPPISTATNTPGKSIRFRGVIKAIAVAISP
jgi:DNA-binding beta-propeller fold protein YncE